MRKLAICEEKSKITQEIKESSEFPVN